MKCGHGVGASVCMHCEGLEDLRRELEEWRSGRRRIRWRIKFDMGNADYLKRPIKPQGYDLFRVTTRPKGTKK